MTFHIQSPPKTVVSVVNPSRTVVVTPEETVKVSMPMGQPGPQGPPGLTGSTGPVGPVGPGGGSFVFTQGVPSNTWTINHTLGYFPNLTVVDSSGAVVEGDITYADDDTLVVTFSASFSGKAFLS